MKCRRFALERTAWPHKAESACRGCAGAADYTSVGLTPKGKASTTIFPQRGTRQKALGVDAGLQALDLAKKTLLDSLRKRASDIETMQRSLDEDIARVAAELHMGEAEVREEMKAK